MRLKSWVKYLLIDLVMADMFFVGIYLYMLRMIEIGG